MKIESREPSEETKELEKGSLDSYISPDMCRPEDSGNSDTGDHSTHGNAHMHGGMQEHSCVQPQCTLNCSISRAPRSGQESNSISSSNDTNEEVRIFPIPQRNDSYKLAELKRIPNDKDLESRHWYTAEITLASLDFKKLVSEKAVLDSMGGASLVACSVAGEFDARFKRQVPLDPILPGPDQGGMFGG